MNALGEPAIAQTAITGAGSGWQGRLELRFEAGVGARTRVAHRLHRGPLLVQRGFYPDGPVCHVYLIHPPGGVVSGDELTLQVEVAPGAQALLTTPAAGKFYRRFGARVASLTQRLRVQGGTLEWLPQENIYYPNAQVALSTVVELSGAARFFGWEIDCFGLPANQQGLERGQLRQRFELWHDGVPLLIERIAIDQAMLQARWGLAGRVASGTLVAYPADASHLECARSIAPPCDGEADPLLACTLLGNTLCCRGVAARADQLKAAFMDLWSGLRASLLGRSPVAPRIWKT